MSSQGEEDEILARLFGRIGTTNRYAVEFGARDGVHLSNTHRLREQGWTCALFDSQSASPLVHQVHLTAENIVPTFAKYGVPHGFDLLSIDVDGNDFHLWRALDGYTPRVVCIEYNATFEPGRSVVMPYNARHKWDKTNYYGASATALQKLGRTKGYSLVDYTPPNLFFVKDEAMLPPAQWSTFPAVNRPWEDY